MLKLINTQIRVIHALALRGMQTQQANLAYGFGWVFFDAFLGFAGLMIMKFALRGFNVPGIPPVTFIVSGLIPWMLFQSSYATPAGAIARGKSLLQLPIVTELDLVLASVLRVFVVYTILFVTLAVIAGFYEDVSPRFPLGIALLFSNMALLGIGFGIILTALNRLYPVAGKFTGFFLRFSMIFSGVIFGLRLFPPSMWPMLEWNPLLHVEELLRVYWLNDYQAPQGISAQYVVECSLGMIFFGLVLERYMRRRLPP